MLSFQHLVIMELAFSNSRIDRNEPENIVKHIINAIFEFIIVVKKLSL